MNAYQRAAFGLRPIVLAIALLFISAPASAEKLPSAAAVASAHPLATAAGHEVLEQGGNAFDAAVAVSAALAVVEPYSSGIGGGGFWLLHRADGREVMVDGRERAPLAAGRDMYLDDTGAVVDGLSVNGPLAAGIPGEPAALVHIAEQYGALSLPESLAPAIRLAKQGFPVTEHYRRMAGFRLEVLRRSDASAAIFLRAGEVPAPGTVIRQPELAETLEAIASRGRGGFYEGAVAERMVEAVRAAGGIWTLRDLAEYRIKEREPVRASYKGARVVSAAPPSSGGVALATMLNVLEGYALEAMEATERDHLIIEAMRRAYRDRAEYLGDPDFVDVPVARLTHPFYAAGLRASIRLDRATPSGMLPGFRERPGGPHTSHFSIVDRAGNYVAATLSINFPFGSGFTVPGTGVLLNDEMDDFAAKPGVPNVYGLVGASANAIEPGKRMLSSMTPTFVDDGKRVGVLGTPGGSRIITMVLLGVLEFVDGSGPGAWVGRPRFHHQYLPDKVFHEQDAFSEAEAAGLRARGHVLEPVSAPYGNMQAVLWDRRTGDVEAASDPRVEGAATVR